MVADCLQRGGELDSSPFSHGKLSSFCFLVLFSGFAFWFCFLVLFYGFVFCVACSYTLDRDRHGWLMATVTRSGSPGHFYQIKMVCAKA